MKNMKHKLFIILFVCLSLTGCGSKQEISNETSKENTSQQEQINTSNDYLITFNGTEITSNTSDVTIDGSTLTITKAGTYSFTGNLENGQVIVDCKDEKIKLILDNCMITSTTSAPICILEADCVEINLKSGTQNILVNQNEFVENENKVDGVIFSKSDLVFSGKGSLSINSSSHGIVSKDTLTIEDGIYSIISTKKGISVNDLLTIENGNIEISSMKDGISCKNDDDQTLGNIIISNGKFVIDSKQDGVVASNTLTIENGDFNIKTGEGSSSVTMNSNNMGFFSPWGASSYTDENDVSTKAFKAGNLLEIKNGSFIVDSVDDSFHSNGDLTVYNGSFDIQTGDDGMHADEKLHIKDGTIKVSYCYEGLEGMEVVIDGGNFDLECHDDGINASSTNPSITINNGEIKIVSNGDCIDSNNTLTITGGTLNLTCNGNGNTALDCDGNYSWTGGDITTNDGSENNHHMMGGNNHGMNSNFNQPGTNNPGNDFPQNDNGQMPHGPGSQKPGRW